VNGTRSSLPYLQEPTICSCPEWNQFRRAFPVSLRPILTLPTHLHPGLQIVLLPISFHTKTPNTFTILPFVPHIQPISSTLNLSLYLMCKSQNFSWGSLRSDISFILGPISPSAPSYSTPELYFPSVWHPSFMPTPFNRQHRGFFFYSVGFWWWNVWKQAT